jgi:multidrug efflux system outer membrane protein
VRPLRVACALALTVATAACATVGPDYARPVVEVPTTYRGATPEVAADATTQSIADEQWSTVFADDALRQLIEAALKQNHDVRIAAARVLQARAVAGIARSDQFPTVSAQASVDGQRTSVGRSDGEASTSGVMQLGGAVAWELDFWGKFRRASEAARAQMLASEWGRRAVVNSLIGDVASSYFSLLAFDLELGVATRTLATREESLRITQIREAGGATSLVDVRQAEQLVLGARNAIVDLQRRTELQENALSVLTGSLPAPVARGRELTAQPRPPELPTGLPSALLARRPDIQEAEQILVAANAEIGVARANYFPQITLTGSGGVASTALSALFTSAGAAWTAGAAAVQPIFTAGRTKSQVALAEARREEAELAYQQTIQRAFREVSDSLVEYRRSRERRELHEQLVTAAQDARRLADLRYQGGVSSYLEVLDSDTRLFSAELDLADSKLAELTAFVEIYRALGGGWQP